MNTSLNFQDRAWEGALLALFPGSATLRQFQENDPVVAGRVVTRAVGIAHLGGWIPVPEEAAFARWLDAGTRSWRTPSSGLTFADVIDRMAGDASVNAFVEDQLKPVAEAFGLPPVQTSMISRLRRDFRPNTKGKRNLLRVLALWIGLRRPEWGWSFEHLLALQAGPGPALELDPAGGVRLALQVLGAGDLLLIEPLNRLRDELARCLKVFEMTYVDARQLKTASTTMVLNLPRQAGDPLDPRAYAPAVRDAFSLIHQVMIHWALQPESSHSGLVIALAAGDFAELEPALHGMLRAKLGEGGGIRVTSFVRTCANLAEAKVVFCPSPREVAVYAGETIPVWVVDAFWSHLYFDYHPGLAGFLGGAGPDGGGNLEATVLRQPDNAPLLVEVARECLGRGRFLQAEPYLSRVLANRPRHVVARTLRLICRINLALGTREFELAWPLFELAEAEGRFLVDHCDPENEEVFCELGQVHYCMARRLVTRLGVREPTERRRVLEAFGAPTGPGDLEDDGYARQVRAEVLRRLALARECFLDGRVHSPSGLGNRSFHWCFRVDALLSVLRAEPSRLSAGAATPMDSDGRFVTCARRLFVSAGWSLPVPAGDGPGLVFDDGALLLRVAEAFESYLATTRCPSYRANVFYAFAILVHDFVPDLTVGLLRMILEWLDEAARQVQALARNPGGPNTIVTCFSQIQPAAALLARIEGASRALADRHRDALAGDDDDLLLSDRTHKFLLSNFLDERLVDYEALC